MTRPTVTVALDGCELLRFDGQHAHVDIVPIDLRLQVAAALNHAASLFLDHQPAPLETAVEDDAVAIKAAWEQSPASTVTH